MLEQKITELITPAVEELGYRLVRVHWQSSQPGTLQIMAERLTDFDLAVEDCEKISRTVSAILDVEDPISAEYNLEVSSPGIDRPLVRIEDFTRYIGFNAKIYLLSPINERKRYNGAITVVQGDIIHVKQPDGIEADIPYSTIEKAKLVLTDALIEFSQNNKKQAS